MESPRNVHRLTVDELEDMGDFLIHFCDGIERHGLVDYEMGVWEEEILDRTKISIPCILLILMNEMQVIIRCIDKYQPAKVAGSGTSKPLF
jgi:hypothetical protein